MALALEGTPVHNNASSGTSLVTGAFTTSNPSQVFIVATINGTTISSISGGGLTWARRIAANVGDTSHTLEEWSAQATGALSGVQFTLTLAGSTTFITVDTFAFSGQDTSTKWDGNASIPAHKDAPTGDPITVSTNNANDVIIGGFRMGSTGSPTAGSGFTQISGANFQLAEYKIVASTQTNLSVSITTGSGNSNGGVADALMAGGGGGFTAKNRRTTGPRVGSRSYY